MSSIVPRHVATITTRGALASLAAQVLFTIAWGIELWDSRPHLTMMLFGLLMTSTMVLGTAAVLARCHMAVAQAFAAGLQVGRISTAPTPDQTARPGLRVVE
jgi:hypothetical protein